MAKRAVVIGSGPNGLTAAICLEQAGIHTTIFESASAIGGGMRSGELTQPGFIHDLFSAVHPLGFASPIWSQWPLAEHGLRWIHSPAPVAHAFKNKPALTLERSLDETVQRLGNDGKRYRSRVAPFVSGWSNLLPEILSPIVHLPRHPFLLARFGLSALPSARCAAQSVFKSPGGQALFAGLAAHSVLRLNAPASAAIGWVLAAAAHATGWPIPRGGSQSIANALGSYFQSLGGEIITGQRITSLRDAADADYIFCDLTPRQLVAIAGDEFPTNYRRTLENFKYGPGAFKMDWALRDPIPWKDPACARAATVHIGDSFEDIELSERSPWEGRVSEKPFVLLAQPSLFDRSRAPQTRHTAWAYVHVPNGFSGDVSDLMEDQIDAVAPGFKATILARHVMKPKDLENVNANLVGGDIGGGAMTLGQLIRRPTWSPYRTPRKGLYLCSSSTPPGGGVHGMCGYNAAKTALADLGN